MFIEGEKKEIQTLNKRFPSIFLLAYLLQHKLFDLEKTSYFCHYRLLTLTITCTLIEIQSISSLCEL